MKLVRGNEFVADVEESVLRRKRDRDLNSVQTLPDRQNLHELLERKAESARRGESAAQKRLSEAKADLEIGRLEQKNSEIALFMISSTPQRLQLHQANQWADQSQREKINLCGELHMMYSFFFFESATQGLRKKLKNCEEFVAKRQIEPDSCGSMNCLCNKRRGPTIVKRFFSQIRDSENNVNSISEERDFHDPETANSSGASYVPTQPLTTIRVPEEYIAAILDCRLINGMLWVLQETFLPKMQSLLHPLTGPSKRRERR